MAKRFTDTAKYDKPWFRRLSPRMKCAWDVLTHKCDHAGVWNIDPDAMAFNVGERVTLAEMVEAFGGRIEVVGDKIVVSDFVTFQYGTLNPANKVHLSVIKRLENIRLEKGHASPLQGAKEKEKETAKEKGTEEGGVGETEPPPPLTPQAPTSDDWKHQLSTENITRAKEAWHECLRKFGAARSNLLRPEEEALARAIKAHGIVAVEMACRGFRAQKASDRWNPAEWVDISRVFKYDNFMRFVNLGVAEFHKQEGAA